MKHELFALIKIAKLELLAQNCIEIHLELCNIIQTSDLIRIWKNLFKVSGTSHVVFSGY